VVTAVVAGFQNTLQILVNQFGQGQLRCSEDHFHPFGAKQFLGLETDPAGDQDIAAKLMNELRVRTLLVPGRIHQLLVNDPSIFHTVDGKGFTVPEMGAELTIGNRYGDLLFHVFSFYLSAAAAPATASDEAFGEAEQTLRTAARTVGTIRGRGFEDELVLAIFAEIVDSGQADLTAFDHQAAPLHQCLRQLFAGGFIDAGNRGTGDIHGLGNLLVDLTLIINQPQSLILFQMKSYRLAVIGAHPQGAEAFYHRQFMQYAQVLVTWHQLSLFRSSNDRYIELMFK